MIDRGELTAATVESISTDDTLPTISVRYAPRSDCAAPIADYGYQAELARRVRACLALEAEIFVELLVFRQLAPLYLDLVVAPAGETRAAGA